MGGHQLSQEGVGLSAPKLTWLGGHEACCACHALTMQGVGGVPPMLLPEAHVLLAWEWTQLLAAPPSGAAPTPHVPHAAASRMLPTLTDRPAVLSS